MVYIRDSYIVQHNHIFIPYADEIVLPHSFAIIVQVQPMSMWTESLFTRNVIMPSMSLLLLQY